MRVITATNHGSTSLKTEMDLLARRHAETKEPKVERKIERLSRLFAAGRRISLREFKGNVNGLA